MPRNAQPIHQYDHFPGGSDELPWLGDYPYATTTTYGGGQQLGVHMIGTAANMPAASFGVQSGNAGTLALISGTTYILTDTNARFTSAVTGYTLYVQDTGVTPSVQYTFVAQYHTVTSLQISGHGFTGTSNIPWQLVYPTPSNMGLRYFQSDTNTEYESTGDVWVKVGAASAGSGYQFNSGTYGADNVGDWSLIEYTGVVGQQFTETNPTPYDPTSFSMGISSSLGVLVVGQPGLSGAAFTVANYNTGGGFGMLSDSGTLANAAGGNYVAYDASSFSGTGSATGFEAGVGTDTGSCVGFACGSLAGTTGGTGNGQAVGAAITAKSQAGPVIGVNIQAGDPTSYTTTGTVSILKCTNIVSGSPGTTYFEVVRPTTGNHQATVFCRSLPTSSTGLASGALWNNGGVVNVV